MSKEKRDLIVQEIQKRILGPGFAEDVFVCNEDGSDEVMNEDPTMVYYTGILFPRPSDNPDDENGEEDVQETEDTHESSDNDDMIEENNTYRTDQNDQNNDADAWQTKYNPFFIGLTTCVSSDTTSINASVNYAKYEIVPENEIGSVKVKLGNCVAEDIYTILDVYSQDENLRNILRSQNKESLREIVEINENVICLNERISYRRPKTRGGRPVYNENNELEYESKRLGASDFPKNIGDPYREEIYNCAIGVINKLFSNNFYRRKPTSAQFVLDLNNRLKDGSINDDLDYRLKVFIYNGKTYVKVLVENKLSNDENRNRNCLFQTELKLESDNIISYTDLIENDIDGEFEKTEYIYRKENNYGKGIGVAVEWDRENESPHWIKTAYMPLVDAKKYSNEADDRYAEINDVCKLYDLSIWSNDTDENIIAKLNNFVSRYQAWSNEQRNFASKEPQYSHIYDEILNEQSELCNRLQDNVNYLRDNPEAMTCFKIANTAMLIQMVISRDDNFAKNRDKNAMPQEGDLFGNADYFRNRHYVAKGNEFDPTYRPFQLAFLLMNVISTFEQNDQNRTDNVDLIWFPTGGGKTEAYLALTALTIVNRRRRNHMRGVSVIMRYTLRLLTSQQFERASNLICSLEFLRKSHPELNLGQINNRPDRDNPITIGMWIGSGTTPNHLEELGSGKYRDFVDYITTDRTRVQTNPFPIAYCPWCGCKLADKHTHCSGYMNDGNILCINGSCTFVYGLPVSYIDDNIYRNPPTLLFATVDKFAGLTRSEGKKLFGIHGGWKRPDLIIQDELHLVSGPLGSMVGLFETIVDEMATKRDADGKVLEQPKIIASTATTRNTKFLVKQLYNKDVKVFPASGVTYDDNFFSHTERNADKNTRRYMGVLPTGKSSVMTEVRMVAATFVAKYKLIVASLKANGIDPYNKDVVYNYLFNTADGREFLRKDIDDYWTLVLYYNSLKDLGRAKSRIPQEMRENIRFMEQFIERYPALDFVFSGFDRRNSEFTSRQDSSLIKQLLTQAETRTEISEREETREKYVVSKMDIVQATNMISVGIDIARWNIMMLMGQPRSTSEYIQSSSRVARSDYGLVINLMNPFRNREYSLFENYTSFHNVFYKYVEPLSATPFTEMTVDKLLKNIFICYMRHIKGKLASEVVENDVNDLKNFIFQKCNDEQVRDYIERSLRCLWLEYRANPSYNLWNDVMTSLRSIDPDCYIGINGVNY